MLLRGVEMYTDVRRPLEAICLMWDHIIRVSLLILVLSHAIVKYLYTVYVENKCFNVSNEGSPVDGSSSTLFLTGTK